MSDPGHENPEDADQNDNSEEDEIPKKKNKLTTRSENRRVLLAQNVQSDNRMDDREEREQNEEETDLNVTFEGETDSANVAGRVISIEMENFMCHSNLVLNFDVKEANCFFVGGPNGSGKSALFAALNIGLGGLASQNDRGPNVKNYIKEGCNRAKIRITLENMGYGKIPEYGPKVVVERTITQTGGTSFMIKNVDRKTRKEETVSTKRRDLENLLTQYGIHLENPIFWMTQDRCRQFLNDTKGGKLYEIFINATELDQAEKDYTNVERQMVEIRAGMESIKLNSETAAGERTKLLEYVEEHEKLEKRRQEMTALSWYLLWGSAKTAFDEMTIATNNLKVAETNCRQLAQKIVQAREMYDDQMNDQHMNKDSKNDMKKKLEVLQEQLKEKNGDLQRYKEIVNQLCDQRRVFTNNMAVRDANLRRARAELEKYESGEAQTTEAANRKRLREAKIQFEEAQTKLKVLEKEHSDKQREHDTAKKRWTDLLAEIQQHKGSMGDRLNRLNKLRMTREQIDRAAKDELSKFGQYTKHILDIIQANRHRFRQVPVGPIGMHINVRDEKWTYPIEKAIGLTITQYVVDNTQDDRLFKELIVQRFGRGALSSVKTIVTKFLPRHRTRQPDLRWQTIERMLEIDNDVAYNVLVDRAAIESTMLIEQDVDARRIMDGDCPDNIRTCFTMSGAKVQGRSRDKGFYRFFPDTTGGFVQFLKVSQNPDTKRLDDEMQELDANYPIAQQKLQELDLQYKHASSEVNQLNGELQAMTNNINHWKNLRRDKQAVITKLDLQLDNNESERPINSLRDAIAEYEKQKAEIQRNLEELKEQIEQAQIEVEEAEETRKELKKQAEEIKLQLRPYAEQEKERDDRLNELMKRIQSYERNEIELKNVLEKYERARITQSRKHDDCVKQAMEDTAGLALPDGQTMPPNLEDMPNQRNFEDLYKRIGNEIEAKERTLPSLEHINERLKLNNANVQANRDAEQRLAKVHEALSEAVEKRIQYFPILRHIITCQLRGEFKRLVNYRGMEADIIVDYENRMIETPVKSKCNQQEIRDLKSLSGGERSYLTACFVLALWGIMDSPFRCMDEFDVFMDSTNRKLIMDLIIRFTTVDCKHSQFILFTPQGITELKKNPRLRVFNMPKLVDGHRGGVPNQENDQTNDD